MSNFINLITPRPSKIGTDEREVQRSAKVPWEKKRHRSLFTLYTLA